MIRPVLVRPVLLLYMYPDSIVTAVTLRWGQGCLRVTDRRVSFLMVVLIPANHVDFLYPIKKAMSGC